MATVSDPSLLEVTYDSRTATATSIDAKTASIKGKKVSELTFDRIGRTTRVVYVDPSNRDAAAASIRTIPGVRSVTPVQRYHALAVNTPLETNDPVFDGTGVPPLYEDAATDGQWDMHVIGLDSAFAYSSPSNGSVVAPNPNALGSTGVLLAIIDTGADLTHPDLAAANVVTTKCFITDTNNTTSTGSFVTDPDGHGTNVSGIAGAAVGNAFGYVGAAGNVSLMVYRVFPTPDSSCSTTSKNPPPQCTASGLDIASAINDAVNNGANVINLSFGGSLCNNGQDPDSLEGGAVANAIANHVIVVAAAGNDSTQNGIGAPGCDPGVIAVGATGWNDGLPNGSGFHNSSRHEYVASYSQYGSNNTLRSSNSWGIVAPGGDAQNVNDTDYLHWIDNAWTSTPFDSADGAYSCSDTFGESPNCHTLIDGTSMSSPHVAGAAALLLSVNKQYASPAAMYQLLCRTADDIGDAHQGCGRLNVYRAMAVAIRDPNLP
ncbi:MAG: S8 family serine peptidase [Candidatus Eremiobacteraeota bacterium]|nr:S8 family serine peptidase [Candidatus Eremiobacteraeota bacterium]